jgi:uncharacterized damage-inducible protein DinB
MQLIQIFIEQLNRESAATRRTVERVPEGHNDWKPHEKSMTLGYLAALVASMPGWAEFMIERDELDLSHPSADRFKTKVVESRAELLRTLDDGQAKSRRALEATTDEHLQKPWRFVMSGQVLFEAPRYIALNENLFCHMAHHRGQLTVYLRLNEAKVPAIYGPSADEIHA